MKKIVTLVSLIITVIACYAQKIEINGLGTVNWSRKAVPMSSEQIAVYGKNKLHGNPNPYYISGNAQVYTVGNVLVTLNYKNFKKSIEPKTYLTGLKKALDPFLGDLSGYNSQIQTINEKEFLITRQPMNGNITKAFYGVSDTKMAALQGSIQCSPEDETEADVVLLDLLKNIKYEVQ